MMMKTDRHPKISFARIINRMALKTALLAGMSLGLAVFAFGCNATNESLSSNGSSVVVTGSPTVDLSWNAVTGATGYYVEQSDNGVNYALVQTVTGATATVTGLNSGATYYFRVAAYNTAGTSSYTSAVSATP
jgi:hypothetical protein